MPYPIVWDRLCNLCTRNKYLQTYIHTYVSSCSISGTLFDETKITEWFFELKSG